jgi:hypothetical protein
MSGIFYAIGGAGICASETLLHAPWPVQFYSRLGDLAMAGGTCLVYAIDRRRNRSSS